MDSTLANVWFFILGFILALYVMLDGFDLGVGIISLFTRGNHNRTLMMSSLSTVWDANEVWLVIWGGALFGAFPTAYGTALNALYIPITVMLIALIFRGISFEFHGYSKSKTFWSFIFGLGSLIAVCSQGAILAGVLKGVKVDKLGLFTGTMFDWLNPLTPLVIVEVLAGYCMLGATYLILKTESEFEDKIRCFAIVTTICAFVMATFTAFVLPIVNERSATQLMLKPHSPFLFLVFGLSALSFIILLYSLFKHFERLPFIMSLMVFLFTFSGFWIAEFPYLLPGAVTISMAASRPNTLIFMIIGIGPIIPIIIAYNIYVYTVFRQKVTMQDHKY